MPYGHPVLNLRVAAHFPRFRSVRIARYTSTAPGWSDADGAVWYADVLNKRCLRVREGGEELQTVTVDRGCFACMLGGAEKKTLFIIATEWRGMDKITEVAQERTGQVLTFEAPSPHAGWP